MIASLSRISWLVLVGACGSHVPLGTADTTGGSGTDAATSDTASMGTHASATGVDPSASTHSSASESSVDESEAGAYEEDSGTGCAFTCPNPPGGGGGGGSFECDIWANDCPDGEKCMPWANDGGSEWNATRCAPLDPNPGELGEACTVEGSAYSGIDSCDVGHKCWNVDADNMGVCAAMCTGSPASPGCPDLLQCSEITEVLPLCIDGCDPLAQDCDDGMACAPELGAYFCAPAGTAAPGEPCDVDVCAAGGVCIDGAAALDCTEIECCAAYCDPNAPDCPVGAACVAIDDDASVGVCAAA